MADNFDYFRFPLIRNPRLVLSACLAVMVLSVLISPANGFVLALVFIVVAGMVALIRPIYDKNIKALCYMLLGMSSYHLFGNAFLSASSESTVPAAVLLSISAASSLVAIVTYFEGKRSGAIFAGGSLVFLLFTGKEPFSIVASLLIFFSAYIIVEFISRITGPENFVKNVIVASFCSGLFVFLAGMASIATGFAFSKRFEMTPNAIFEAAGVIIFASIGFIFVDLSLIDAAISRCGFKRVVEEERVLFSSVEPSPQELLQQMQSEKKPIGLNLKKKK